MPDTYRRLCAPGGVQIDKTRPRPEPGKKIKLRKPRGKCTLLRAGGAEQAPRGTGAYCVPPLPQTPTPGIYYRLEKRVIPQGVRKKGAMQANEKTIIGVDHGYAAIKTAHCVFSTGLTAYSHEPYTRQAVLEYEGKWYVCGTGRQPVQREKMANDTYYLLTLAAIARELERRRLPRRCTVALASGLPLTSYGRQKGSFKKYLLRSPQPVKYRYEGEAYEVTVEGVWLYPQGYSALAMHPDLIAGEPSFLLMDIGGWTVDMMRLDDGSASAGTCRSLELGMIRCLDEAREQVLRDTGLSLTDAQIERVLSGQPCSMDEEARGVIERQGRQYTEHLLSAAMEAGFDLKALPVVMLGGGAGVAARNLRESDRLCRVIPLTDSRINAAGFERLAQQMAARGITQ